MSQMKQEKNYNESCYMAGNQVLAAPPTGEELARNMAAWSLDRGETIHRGIGSPRSKMRGSVTVSNVQFSVRYS